ncbi:MAG: hypothetical protein R3264_05235, partial [Anaerolineae bacterium]|nr:hypothetical protein [Anaerolineae bacterium]
EVYEETPYVLIIDQFEEIITTHPARWEDREGFFQQLEQAMLDDPLLWVVLTMREDYIAQLEPYKHLLSNNLRAKYYMQRMGYDAALEAVKNPAERYGRPFAEGVAESLVDNLRQIRVQDPQSPGELEIRPGQFIEPVQLQVVCFQLWENLKDRPLDYITEQDLKELGNVDTALGQFYEKALERVIKQTNVTEIELRNWFETKLITEAGTRGTVYQGTDFTGGIPNEAVNLLANEYLVRAEVKAGGTWYELVHDRLVYPILQANQMWKLDQPIIQLAHNWIEDRRNPDRLLQTQQLGVALEGNWQSLGEEVEEFIVASQQAQLARDEELRQERERARLLEIEQARALAEAQRERAEEQAKAAERLRKRFWMLLFLAIVAGFFALFAGFLTWLTIREQAETEAALSTAQAVATLAEDNAAEARKIREGQRATETAISAQVEVIQDQGVEDLNATAESIEATTTAAAQTAEARLTAEADSETTSPTETAIPDPITPSPTPTGPYEPPTDTPSPTATATATPDVAATEIAQSLLAELNIIKIAQTRIAERVEEIASDTPGQGCRVEPDSTFREIWARNQDALGCPLQAEPIAGAFAEQSFENGFMLWSQILEQFFVTIGSANSGTWQLYSRGDFPENSDGCEPTYPTDNPELIQPVSGFGAIWCTWPELQRQIGYGLAQEYAVSNNLVQEFEGGFIIRNSFGLTYILFKDSMVYELVR